MCYNIRVHRGIAQLVEYWSPKPWVVGSSPSAPAKKKAKSKFDLAFFNDVFRKRNVMSTLCVMIASQVMCASRVKWKTSHHFERSEKNHIAPRRYIIPHSCSYPIQSIVWQQFRLVQHQKFKADGLNFVSLYVCIQTQYNALSLFSNFVKALHYSNKFRSVVSLKYNK